MASAIIIFDSFEKLDYKGKVICSAFSVGGAYVFGGQLGYVAGVEPSMLNVYVITKLLCGIIGVIIAIIFLKYENKGWGINKLWKIKLGMELFFLLHF